MNILISPRTPYNSMITKPDGTYTINTVITSTSYSPVSVFTEERIPEFIEKIKELLQYFKGNHSINVNKLLKVEPFEYHPSFNPSRVEIRDWKIITDDSLSVEFTVTNPKVATVTICNEKSPYGERGVNIQTVFGIDGIRNFNWGVICSSIGKAKEYAEYEIARNESIKHWVFVNTKKPRKVKCNHCGKSILNTEAEQCSVCGRYFCSDCLSSDTCSDCEGDE